MGDRNGTVIGSGRRGITGRGEGGGTSIMGERTLGGGGRRGGKIFLLVGNVQEYRFRYEEVRAGQGRGQNPDADMVWII